MRKGVVMPAHLVDDGVHSANNKGASLFVDYATVADNTGVYTTADYAGIVDYLVSERCASLCICLDSSVNDIHASNCVRAQEVDIAAGVPVARARVAGLWRSCSCAGVPVPARWAGAAAGQHPGRAAPA